MFTRPESERNLRCVCETLLTGKLGKVKFAKGVVLVHPNFLEQAINGNLTMYQGEWSNRIYRY